ncbi:uncharacterized protein LOC143570117 [Bidens hawaiensis]|uniref:uncharacterized protein LOC143570117 n=1 Tax=Bidens hawaiensis TaxID=980011 RepID=UPI00404A48AC
MEPSSIASHTAQNSKKRTYAGSSLSYGEPEVIEIAPPLADQSAKLKAKGKQKEVAYHEIIDVDIDDDSNDLVLLEGKFEPNKKAKGNMCISLGSSSSSKLDSKKAVSNKNGKEIPTGFNPGFNNFFDLDDYVFDDDYGSLQSHFNNVGIPMGYEKPFPWLPELVPKKMDNNPATLLVTSSAKVKKASLSQPYKVDPTSTSTVLSSSKSSAPIHKHVSAQTMHSNYSSNSSNTQVGNGPSSFPQLGLNTGYDQLAMNNAVFSMNDLLLGSAGAVNGPSPVSASSVKNSSKIAKLVDDDVKKRYESFKKFDTVMHHSDHHYARKNSSMKQESVFRPPKNWSKRIQEEWRILEKDLPDTIFVRAYESRMDLLRAVIIGAEGTPYHDGLFFFDVCFPSSYPNTPPLVYYHSGGLRINPNLYHCGKVCLSLLNTWTGGHKERWLPGTSTMLQVLVSIQGLILNMKPYFNEPGYANSSGSELGEKASLQYNENTLILSLKTMVYAMNNPPKHFEDLVIGHFQHRTHDILMACKAYTEGVQVGCLVKGGVQDVDEGNKSCSQKFKNDVGLYIKTLIAAFEKIGAKEAQEFLYLSVEESSVPPSPAPAPGFPTLLPLYPTSFNPSPNITAHGYPPFSYNSLSAGYNHQPW